MPEGHTIHRLARDIRRDLGGTRISAETRQGRFAASAERLDGTVLQDTEAYGKHLFVHFDTAHVLHVHLGLVGKFVRHRPHEAPSAALRLRLTGDDAAWDLTGPMTCELTDPGHREMVIGALGPDPLRRDGRRDRFVDALRSSRRATAVQLLDQRVIAGIGNVYRAEVLFLVGVHPATRGADLEPVVASSIWDRLRVAMRDGVRRNRIVTREPSELPAGPVQRDDALYVYKRDGLPCRRCGSDIARTEMGGRKIWWCPTCQPA